MRTTFSALPPWPLPLLTASARVAAPATVTVRVEGDAAHARCRTTGDDDARRPSQVTATAVTLHGHERRPARCNRRTGGDWAGTWYDGVG